MSFSKLTGPTIAVGQSLSDAVDCNPGRLAYIIMPQGWDTADLTFQISADGINYYDLCRPNGEEIRVVCNGLGRAILIPSDFGDITSYLKFRSGSVGRPIVQSKTRTFSVVLMEGQAAGGGGFVGTEEWMFEGTPSAPPTGSEARLNSDIQMNATLLWLTKTTATGVDAGAALMGVIVGQQIHIQKKDDSTKYQQYDVETAPVDRGSYIEIGIKWTTGGADVPELRVLVSLS